MPISRKKALARVAALAKLANQTLTDAKKPNPPAHVEQNLTLLAGVYRTYCRRLLRKVEAAAGEQRIRNGRLFLVWDYHQIHDVVRRARAHFSPWYEQGSTPTDEDIEEWVIANPDAEWVGMWADISWEAKVIGSMCGSPGATAPEPNVWARDHVGRILGRKRRTVDKLVRGATKPHGPKGPA